MKDETKRKACQPKYLGRARRWNRPPWHTSRRAPRVLIWTFVFSHGLIVSTRRPNLNNIPKGSMESFSQFRHSS
ncbi:hypothetical protein B0H12DRAFT_1100543 [Mycena haematopus]|nr:hypothetical protein B0H12DRAFT_1100543 [Mycena haematopus]